MSTSNTLTRAAALAAVLGLAPALTAAADGRGDEQPQLVGRAVLPVETYAEGPPAGNAFAGQTINGIQFPLTQGQPVEGFSAVVEGRRHGEWLAMPDNGFGNKQNSRDFLIRAYYLGLNFETAEGGSGTVAVRDFIQFSDPDGLIGFPIVNEGTAERRLTGADIDPESLQRGPHGDLWVGDEFGPWILHFTADGRLLEPPIGLPDGIASATNPFVDPAAVTLQNSRGIEGMGISVNGRYLYPTLEGATMTDPDQTRRLMFEYDTRRGEFTGERWQYRVDHPAYLVSDIAPLDHDRLVVMERDGGRGLTAVYRRVYVVDLDEVGADGFLVKRQVVDLAAIPDPDLISLPPIHEGDVGLGDPFRVTCESVEAIRVIKREQVLVGCDNNFPNAGRNPGRADDNEFILVDVPGLSDRRW